MGTATTSIYMCQIELEGQESGKQEATGSVKHDWKCEIIVEGTRYDGRWCQMDGATSSACCDLKMSEHDH